MPRAKRIAPDGRKIPVPGPGAASTRTDLAAPSGTLPPAAPIGLPYGEHQALIQAQKAVGVGSGPVVSSGGADPALTVTPIHAPTQNPTEPVTTMSGITPPPPASLSQLLEQMNPTADVRALLDVAKGMGL